MALALLLDHVADRETTRAASTWRFSPASVRRALDNGMTAAGLIDELRDAAGKPLPQPLEYLVHDVARRHGEVGVRAAGCVIVGAEALVAEIAVHRKLASLRLQVVAPTVLVTRDAAEVTVTALRSAGYAPVLRDGGGTVTVRPVASIPAELAELIDSAQPPPADPHEHAVRLLRAPARSRGPVLRRGVLLDALFRERDTRPSHDWMRLAWKLEAGLPTRVHYLQPDGRGQDLVISDVELHGDAIDVWCEETSGYRRLELARVRLPAVHL